MEIFKMYGSKASRGKGRKRAWRKREGEIRQLVYFCAHEIILLIRMDRWAVRQIRVLSSCLYPLETHQRCLKRTMLNENLTVFSVLQMFSTIREYYAFRHQTSL